MLSAVAASRAVISRRIRAGRLDESDARSRDPIRRAVHLRIPFTPRPRAASAQRQRTRPQRHPRPARKRIHSFCVRCDARLSRCLLAPRRQPEVLRDGDIRPSPSPRPRPRPRRRRPAGPPPDRDRPLRRRRGCRWRHRPGPGCRTGPGRLPGRARRRTPGLGTCPGLPGAMRAVPGAVPGAGGRIAPPDGGIGAGMQSAPIAPSSADRPLDRHPHWLHVTHSGTARRSNAYDLPVVHTGGYTFDGSA